MIAEKRIILIINIYFFSMLFASLAQAQTIAIFPLDSQNRNVPNMEVTRYIADKLKLKGLDVIHEQDIIKFMTSKNIQWLGSLRSEDIRATKEDLGADLVLLGTIINNTKTGSSYLILNLNRTRDAKTIWISSDGLSLINMQRLLGLNQPKTIDELWRILVNKTLATWPDNLRNYHKTD